MTIHHLRNTTMIIESGKEVILIDPMIGPKGSAAPPFAVIRSKPRKNPILNLPIGAQNLIDKTTHCLITYQHADHLDKTGIAFLKDKQIPITCSKLDSKDLISKGLNIVNSLEYWKESKFFDGCIVGVPARHGYGGVAKLMGNVMGFYFKLKNEPSVYLSSDTIYTKDVDKVLTEYKPDISVVACGTAQLDVYKPLLMTIDDIISFVKTAPKYVVCNHMEAVNHCHTDRATLKKALVENGLTEHAWIPEDGEKNVY